MRPSVADRAIRDPVQYLMPSDLDVLIDELYALPLERFVPERGVLAKPLRAEGRREEAARVAALTKPSIVAWAVNQVVRAQPVAAAALWAAGDAVLEAQARVVAGEARGPDLREAIDIERQALKPLVDAARGLMTGVGAVPRRAERPDRHRDAARRRDRPGRPAEVAQGRLTRPLRLRGLEAAMAAAPSDAHPQEDDRTRAASARTSPTTPRTPTPRGSEERERARARQQAAAGARRGPSARATRRASASPRRCRPRRRPRGDARPAGRLKAAELGLEDTEERLAEAHGALEEAEDAVDRARAEAG